MASKNVFTLHQGNRKHLKLGDTTLRWHFSLKKEGAFSKNKEGTSLFISKSSGGHVPPVPPGSYVYALTWFLVVL